MEKYIKDGMVAVLVSPGFGAGWSTWAENEEQRKAALFHPKFVQAALDGMKDIEPIVEEVFGKDSYFYDGGWRGIEVLWLPEGTAFIVNEYDGYETLRIFDEIPYDVA